MVRVTVAKSVSVSWSGCKFRKLRERLVLVCRYTGISVAVIKIRGAKKRVCMSCWIVCFRLKGSLICYNVTDIDTKM